MTSHPVTKEVHCNHECVCRNYYNGSGWGYDESGKYGWQDHSICKIPNCDDDARNNPDPLEVLGKWIHYMLENTELSPEKLWCEMRRFVKELRTNPDAVIARGKEEGWL